MRKIPTVFKRDKKDRRFLTTEVNAGCQWVLDGEGVATRKRDGTACMVHDGKLFKRYAVKKKRTAPSTFRPAQDPDPVTGEQPGWVPVLGGPEDKWFMEAFAGFSGEDGTYELCGPKVQGNPEGLDAHQLIRHGSEEIPFVPRTHAELDRFLARLPVEGIVFYHPDGRMAKIRQKDFRREG